MIQIKNHRVLAKGIVFDIPEKYEFQKVVGKGAFGVVIAVVDTTTGERLAIKKITDAFRELADTRRFLREIQIMRHVRHDNLLSLKALLVPPVPRYDDVYLISSRMDTTLKRIIRSSRNRLSDDHFRLIVYQILCGLKYLHSAGILHRDLKPDNILINTDCSLKICDFGLSRGFLEEEGAMTQYVVTRFYRAPEIMLAVGNYGPAIDVWATGCIFAELFTQDAMFRGSDYIDMLNRIVQFTGNAEPVPAQPEGKAAADHRRRRLQRIPLPFVTNPRARQFMESIPLCEPSDLSVVFPTASSDARHLLSRMLCLDPTQRISVDEALAHPYLAPFRSAGACETTCPSVFRFQEGALPAAAAASPRRHAQELRRLIREEALACPVTDTAATATATATAAAAAAAASEPTAVAAAWDPSLPPHSASNNEADTTAATATEHPAAELATTSAEDESAAAAATATTGRRCHPEQLVASLPPPPAPAAAAAADVQLPGTVSRPSPAAAAATGRTVLAGGDPRSDPSPHPEERKASARGAGGVGSEGSHRHSRRSGAATRRGGARGRGSRGRRALRAGVSRLVGAVRRVSLSDQQPPPEATVGE